MDSITTERPAPPAWPKVGELYVWEMLRPHAAIGIRVVAVNWNGEEWWVESEIAVVGRKDGKAIPNELSRFHEACDPYRMAMQVIGELRLDDELLEQLRQQSQS